MIKAPGIPGLYYYFMQGQFLFVCGNPLYLLRDLPPARILKIFRKRLMMSR